MISKLEIENHPTLGRRFELRVDKRGAQDLIRALVSVLGDDGCQGCSQPTLDGTINVYRWNEMKQALAEKE